ncbi:MAG: aromatic amino acid transport family protein [Patescibacteria group bacterium]
MTQKKIKQFLLGFGVLSGTIIGAGVFSLPYIFKFSGISLGSAYLAVAALAYIAIYLMYAEIVEKTPGDHRLVGYSRIYLGNWASVPAVLMTIIQGILVLTIYLILSESFAHLLFRSGSSELKIVIFWFISSAIILLGLKKIAKTELVITLGILGIFGLVFFFGLENLGGVSRQDFIPVWGNLFLPLGPVLFALSGRAAIPAIVRLGGPASTGQGGPVKKVIIWGVAVPALVYLLFAFSVVAISPIVTQDAVTGLRMGIPGWASWLLGVLGILALISSYLAIGYDVDKSLETDLKVSYWSRFALVMLGPIALYFGGLRDFLSMISFTGGIFIALESIFIIWIWLKMKKLRLNSDAPVGTPTFWRRGWISGPLIALFSIAIIHEIIKAIPK